MRVQREQQSKALWLLGGLMIFGLLWWLEVGALPIFVGIATGILALATSRNILAEQQRWLRSIGILGCGIVGLLSIIGWFFIPALSLALLTLLAMGVAVDNWLGTPRRDRLTGLQTLATFTERAEEELSRGLRFGRPAILAVITLDQARTVRAQHGRRAAALALSRVAETLRTQSRSYDLLARLDGSRFAILLPETTRDEAIAVTARIRAAIATISFIPPGGEQSVPLTATVGLADHPGDGSTIRALLASVEQAASATSAPAAPTAVPMSERVSALLTNLARITSISKGSDIRVTTFIVAIWLVALALFIATYAPIPQSSWVLLAFLAFIGVIARFARINLYGNGSISNHFVAIMASGILLGPTGAMLVGVAAGFLYWPWKNRARVYFFDGGTNALIGGVLSLLEPLLARAFPFEAWFHLPLLAHGLILGAACYVLNAGFVVTVMALSGGGNVIAIWRERFAWFFPYTLVFGILAVFMAQSSVAFGPIGLLMFAAPAFMILLATRQYIDQTKGHVAALNEAHQRLSTLNQQLAASVDDIHQAYADTLEAFSGMLDARDSETEGHSQRVVRYAVAIGRAMALGPDEIASLEIGALLHDIGKVGVSDTILRKKGPLTAEEWVEMRRHPEVGHSLTSRIAFLHNASPIVRHHHERWDGTGYPDGLCGENIPLGARIFAIADSFDAMISDRPYRRGLPLEQVVGELRRGAGGQFDPQLVALFITLVENEGSLAALCTRAEHHPEQFPRLTLPAPR